MPLEHFSALAQQYNGESLPHCQLYAHKIRSTKMKLVSFVKTLPHRALRSLGIRENNSLAVMLFTIVKTFVGLYMGTDWIKKCT